MTKLWSSLLAAGSLVTTALGGGHLSQATCGGILTTAEVKNIDEATWSKMIRAVGKQRTSSENMMKTYLEVRRAVMYNKDAIANAKRNEQPTMMKTSDGKDALIDRKNALLGETTTFGNSLAALLAGSTDFSMPPSDVICNGLIAIDAAWTEYKTLLDPGLTATAEGEVDYSDEIIGNLTAAHSALLTELRPVEQMYVSLAETYMPSAPGKTISLAEEQCLLAQKMSKETLFIHFHYHADHYLEELHHSVNLFDTNHQGLLKGMNSMGLNPLAKRCTLWEMRTVTNLWLHMKPPVQKVLDTEHTDDEILSVVATKNIEVLDQMTKAVDLYMLDDNSACDGQELRLTNNQWANGINEAGRGQMFSQKSTRLILQVAQPNPANLKVDADELVDTLAIGLWTLNTLIEGDVVLDVPSLPTQDLVRDFVNARETWKKFSATLLANTQLNGNQLASKISKEIIDRVAYLRETYFDQMAATVDNYVITAQKVAPQVHSEVIFIAGRQRTLQCKLASEALLIDLGSNVEHHRKLAAESIRLYQEVHWRLLYGEKDAEGNELIKRTKNICMLRQMLTVIDSKSRIDGITGTLMESAKDTSSKADLQAFHEIINAGYGIMNAAVEMYIAGHDSTTCTLTPTSEEWDMAFGMLGRLRGHIERVTKDFLFTMEKMNTTDGDINIYSTLEELDDILHKVTYGNTAEYITTPPCQPCSNKLFDIKDAYELFKVNLLMAESKDADGVLEEMTAQSQALVGHIQELMDMYIDDAWEKDKSVEAAMVNATSTLTMALERAQKQVAYSMHQGCTVCLREFGKLEHTIELFDTTYSLLLNGNEENTEERRRLDAHAAGEAVEPAHNGTKTTVKAINQGLMFSQLRSINDKWRLMKPKLEKIVTEYKEDGDFPTTTQIVEQADLAKAATSGSEILLESASTRTTTPVPLFVLTPLPLTGAWAGGKTMRTAALFAETIINQQQVVFPKYAIVNTFRDDKCDSDEGMRLVLKESASATTDYVALGGGGCTHVCASAAFAAASMNLPFLSYECAGRELSSTTEYPGFTRMGTPLVQAMDFITPMAEHFEWSHLAVVTADPGKYRGVADFYEEKLNDAGIPNSYYASFDYTIEETINMAASFVADNRRVIILGGDERFMRRVVCGTMVAGAPLGILWIYEGVFSEKWWTLEDADLLEEHAICTSAAITNSFRNAINLAGLGKALPHEEELELECFKGYTSKSFLEAVHQHLEAGYPMPGDNETMIERPHSGLIAHAADAVCALMKAMKHMKDEGYGDVNIRGEERTPEFYSELLAYVKTELVFQGVSGWVNFTGNDKPETISLKQVRGDQLIEVGMAFPNGSMMLNMESDLVNNTWVTDMNAAGQTYPMLISQLMAAFLCFLNW